MSVDNSAILGDLVNAGLGAELNDGSVDVSGFDIPESGTAEVLEANAGALEGTEAESAKVPAKAETPEPAADDPETLLTKELEELGIKTPAAGQDNRIPYQKMRKIFDNHKKKLGEAQKAEIEKVRNELSPFKARAEEMERVDKLIAEDPQRYIQMLAVIHPDKYGQYLNPSAAAAAATKIAESAKKPAAAIAELGDEPQPDVHYEDGALGYSAEQWKRKAAWDRKVAVAEAKAEAKAEIEAEFGGMKKAWEQSQRQASNRQWFDRQMADLRKHYGEKLVDDNIQEVATYGKANNLDLPTAAAAILVPKLRADEARIRKETIEEMKKRPAAASSVGAKQTKPTTNDAPKSLTEKMYDALRMEGLIT